MFIATRLPLIISAKSEMLSISLFAEEVRRPYAFYKHYVPTARFRLDSFERLLLRQSRTWESRRFYHALSFFGRSFARSTRFLKRIDFGVTSTSSSPAINSSASSSDKSLTGT